MKAKKMNKVLATTMITTMCITPFASIANAMEPVSQEPTYINTQNEKDNIAIGTEYTVTNKDMADYLKANGVSENLLKEAGFYSLARYREGVNKIVKVKGGWDIYLSRETLDAMRLGGSGVSGSVITRLLGSLASKNEIGIIASVILSALVGSPKGGMIFKMRLKKVTIGVAGEIEEYYCASKVYQ